MPLPGDLPQETPVPMFIADITKGLSASVKSLEKLNLRGKISPIHSDIATMNGIL